MNHWAKSTLTMYSENLNNQTPYDSIDPTTCLNNWLRRKMGVLVVSDGLDIEAQGRTDNTCVFPIKFQNNRRLPWVVKTPATEIINTHTHTHICIQLPTYTQYASKIEEKGVKLQYVHHKNTHFLFFSLDLANDTEKPHWLLLKPHENEVDLPTPFEPETDGRTHSCNFESIINDESGIR